LTRQDFFFKIWRNRFPLFPEDTPLDSKQLENVYKRNLIVIKRQIDGLTHEDSLIQPPFRGNCLNFVLGHVAASRQGVLKALGADPLMSEEHIKRYTMDAEPVTGEGADIMTLDEIMEVMDQSQKSLSESLLKLTPEDLTNEIGEGEEKTTLGNRIEFLSWHEAYHTGQTEYLRQLAGTDDKVI
jgi:uncharacterized damage-inducible protein DinB